MILNKLSKISSLLSRSSGVMNDPVDGMNQRRVKNPFTSTLCHGKSKDTLVPLNTGVDGDLPVFRVESCERGLVACEPSVWIPGRH